MVNRRHIRIKVMQSVYSILKSNYEDLKKEEKFLLFSIQKAIDLYILQLLLLVEVKNLAFEHLEIKKKKHLATAEDISPNLKFITMANVSYVTEQGLEKLKKEIENGN